ncbi:MAG: GtrA family protein [Bryobacteraceae bacterium]
MMAEGWRTLGIRWLKFNAVGAMGVLVQLVSLGVLVSGFGLNYMAATAIAVEIAVLHNFVWHQRFTWKDRGSVSRKEIAFRLLKFNLSNGGISIVGNLVLMKLLTGAFHLNYLAANGASIAVLSLANFAVSHTFVFQRDRGK